MTKISQSEFNEKADLLSEAPAPGLGVQEGDKTTLLDLLIVLAERKRFIFAVTAVFALSAIVISLLLPKRYTATVLLLPPQQSSSMSAALASQLSSLNGMAALAGGNMGLKGPYEMYVVMLTSETVEDAMVRRYNLMAEYHKKRASDARIAFKNAATVVSDGTDGLIHITIVDGDPQRAAELANGYVDQFRTLTEHLAITEASQRRLFFEHELEQAKNNLADAEEAMKQTEQATGLIQLDGQARALIESAASLRAEIAAREVQIQGMQTYATGENAHLVQAQQELQGLRAQLAKLGGSEESAGGFTGSKGKVPEASLEYIRKLRDVKYYETIFDILARQFEMAKLDEAKQGAIIQVVDPAVAPDHRSSPKRTLIVILSTFVGFFIGVFAALYQAVFLRMKSDPEANFKLQQLRNALTIKG